MNLEKVIQLIKDNHYEESFVDLYGSEVYGSQKKRYLSLLDNFSKTFNQRDIRIVSSPGRTELGGNHTDHNHGRVLAASIQLDSIAVISPNEENVVQIYSEGFPDLFKVSLHELDLNAKIFDSTTSLIRGVVSIFKSRGKKIGGFNAYITSDVLVGSGLSSSASIEVLLGKIISVLFNEDSVDSVELAIIGQEAENIFLGKPCGLMDQLACAYGGIVAIDFEDPSEPDITALDYSFNNNGYQLLVIDTGGDHADLTDDYAAIPMEMKNVAKFFGEKNLRDLKREDFFREIPELTSTLGDRAVLRALHFFNEDERVVSMVDHLQQNRIEKYLDTVQKSGDSSYKYLQNVFTSKHVSAQKISLAIALTECFPDFKGAVRVHGGGFAGTIQVYLKLDVCQAYTDYMEHFFGPQSVTPLKIREKGAVTIL